MSGEDNVKQIVARKLHYLVAEPYGARSDWVEEFENDEDFARGQAGDFADQSVSA